MLAGARGFDTYLGIPYSDDMGQAARSPCPGDTPQQCSVIEPSDYKYTEADNVHGDGEIGRRNLADLNDNGPQDLSPLVFQTGGTSSTPGAQTKTGAYAKNTTVLEQPVDFSKLAPKYNEVRHRHPALRRAEYVSSLFWISLTRIERTRSFCELYLAF